MNEQNKDINTIKLFVGFIAIVVAGVIMKLLANIFLPFAMALLLYFVFNKIVKKLVRKKIPRALAIIFLLLFIFIIFYSLGLLLYSGAISLIDNMDNYLSKALIFAKNFSEKIHIPISEVEKYIATIDWTNSLNMVPSLLSKIFGSFTSFVGNLFLVLVYLTFMLAGGESLTQRIGKAFEPEKSTKIKNAIDNIEINVRQYISIKTFIGVLHGSIAGIIIFIAGVDFVFLLAFLFALFNYIPNIGSVIVVIATVIICLFQYGLSLRLLLLLGALMIVQFFIGNVVEPRLTGKRFNLSPIVILVSLIFWGYIWGIVGMILSLPLTLAVKVICENIPSIKPIVGLAGAD